MNKFQLHQNDLDLAINTIPNECALHNSIDEKESVFENDAAEKIEQLKRSK